MTQFTTGTQIGKKKDLSSIVKDVTPMDTPFVKSLGSEKAINTLFNWVDKSTTYVAKSAIAEGADVTADAATGRVERTNYTELFARGVEVTTSSQHVEQAGMASLAERIADEVKMIQRQKETVFLNAQAASATITNRTTASFQAQLVAGATIDKASATMTKAFFDAALLAAYNNGADVDTVYCAPAMKRLLSTLLTFAAVTREAGQGKVITDSVDVYQTDFGDVSIIPNRFQVADDVLFADSSQWKEKVLTPMVIEDIAKTGLADKKLVHTETGLKNENFAGSYAITSVAA